MATGGRADRERRFWDRYRHILLSRGVRSASVGCYVMRAEQFIRTFPKRRRAAYLGTLRHSLTVRSPLDAG